MNFSTTFLVAATLFCLSGASLWAQGEERARALVILKEKVALLESLKREHDQLVLGRADEARKSTGMRAQLAIELADRKAARDSLLEIVVRARERSKSLAQQVKRLQSERRTYFTSARGFHDQFDALRLRRPVVGAKKGAAPVVLPQWDLEALTDAEDIRAFWRPMSQDLVDAQSLSLRSERIRRGGDAPWAFVLRLGHRQSYYMTESTEDVGHWMIDNQGLGRWESAANESRDEILRAFAIARRRRAPSLVVLPGTGRVQR